MLKLEPTEAEQVALVAPSRRGASWNEVADNLDHLLRKGEKHKAIALADSKILMKSVGLDQHDCNLLAQAAQLLRDRRLKRGPVPYYQIIRARFNRRNPHALLEED